MSTQNTQPSRRGFLGVSMLFTAGALTACSSGGGKTATGAGGTKTLRVWYHQYGETGTKDAAISYAKAFTAAHPGISVEVTWVPGDYVTKLHAALLTADAPDLFELGDFDAGMARHGQLAPLDDLYGDTRSDFDPKSLDFVTVDGKAYGVMMMRDTTMLYYRKSVLDKAGVKPPQTYDDLVSAAKELTHGDNKGLFVANNGIGDTGYLMLWSCGGSLVDSSGKAAFATPQAAETITALRRLQKDKSTLQGFTTDWWDPTAFAQGVVPLQWSGLWAMPAVIKSLGDDFGVLPWPAYGASGTPATRGGGWATVVNAKRPNVDAAKQYARWLWIDQAEKQKDWAVGYGFHIPARATVAAATDKLSSGPAKDAVDLTNKYAKVYPSVWDNTAQTAFTQAVTNIVLNGGDAASLLASAQVEAQAEFDKEAS